MRDATLGLRDYQVAGVARAQEFLASAGPGDRLMQIFPTGSGKSYMQAALLAATPGLLQVVPSVEIAEGIFEKLTGRSIAGCSEAVRRRETEGRGIYTVKRLLNLLMEAAVPLPKYLSFDESHHTTDDTHSTLHAITGLVPAVGWTATGYRGTPQETKKLHDSWKTRITGLSLVDAVARGIISQPALTTWPLLNDDEIAVTNGEFKTSAVDSVFRDKFADIVARIKQFRHREFRGSSGVSTAMKPPITYRWDRPTMVAVSSKFAVEALVDALNNDSCIPCAVGVTEKTTRGQRDAAFASTIACETILVQINVVSEGVDLPLRRLIDLSPTMSPVRWVQRLGRIKRPICPGESPPEYIACCHNITRHGYLEAGVLPVTALIEAQKAWGVEYKPTRKSLARAIGLDGFGRFQVSTVPLANGLLVSLYALQTKNGLDQYAVVLHPAVQEPYFFHKQNALTGEKGTFTKPDGTVIQYNEKTYGPWRRIQSIPDVEGCLSIPAERITEKMAKKTWPELAGQYGLDPTFEPDGRTFQILPILWGSKLKFPKE